MPFGIEHAGWAYVSPYNYSCARPPYLVWPRWGGRGRGRGRGYGWRCFWPYWNPWW